MKTITILWFLCVFSALSAQEARYISVELLGSGGVGSVNYERTFMSKPRLNLAWRMGFSFAPVDRNNGTALVFPLMVHGIAGPRQHKLDLGAGQAVSVTTRGRAFVLMPLSAGYRYQPASKNYYLRIAYTPIVSYLLDFQWQHWGGVTIAYKL